jgi:iron complex outermembrane receptor protein
LLIFLCTLISVTERSAAQNIFRAVITSDDEHGDTLSGATAHVLNTDIAGIADSNGLVELKDIPDGEQIIEFSYIGYFKKKYKINFPRPPGAPVLMIKLQSQVEEVENVLISTTRNYQKPEYLPIQVDVIEEDDVEQESHDKPSDVSHILKEQPGIQLQRTSAISGTFGIRLEGLNPDYTQILKDGFPLFGGFSNVIGITEIPPLDIQQIEIVKGPASTLYGGDAIAGVINLISKQPTPEPDYELMFNGESAKAFDGGLYAAQKFKWFAFSLTGLYRYQQQKDWSGYGFTETPYLQRYSISPQLYFDLSKHVQLNVGGDYTHEYRVGGTDAYFNGAGDSSNYYYEKNTSNHLTSNFKLTVDFGDKGTLTFKNAFNYFTRSLQLPFYLFDGVQLASISEVNYHYNHKKYDLVAGIDFKSDQFNEGTDSSAVHRNYSFLTVGAFGQFIYHIDEKTAFEGGLRIDYNNVYGAYPLPHAAILENWNSIFSTRVNFGMGYQLPTIFRDESEEARYINVLPIASNLIPELSLGGTVGLNVKLPSFGGVNIILHQLYFITHILHPLLADTASIPNCPTGDCVQTSYQNGDGFVQSDGVETGVTLKYRGIETGIDYTLTDDYQKIDNVLSITPLTSKHILSLEAGYSIKNFFIGTDCYYYSPVKLSNGSTGHYIWEVGFSAQYSYKFLLIFANLENLLNITQTSFGPIVYPNPTYARPAFAEIYAPLEGRLFNAGVKIRLQLLKPHKGKNDD